jgi:hypothetical protein
MSCQRPRLSAFRALCAVVLVAMPLAEVARAQYDAPNVQALSLAGSRNGVIASDALLAMDNPPGDNTFFAVLVGVTDWSSLGTTFMEAGAQRCALHASCDAVRPYAASQIADTEYDLRMYDRVLGDGMYYRYRVERLENIDNTTTWRALICTGSSGCREIMRRNLMLSTLPYAVIGAESNGAVWNTLRVRNARLLESRALRWTGWCGADMISIIWPEDGQSEISACDGRLNAWTVTRHVTRQLGDE